MPKTTTKAPDVTVAVAAAELGVAIRTVNSWIAEGRLKATRPDGARKTYPWSIPRSEITRLRGDMYDVPGPTSP